MCMYTDISLKHEKIHDILSGFDSSENLIVDPYINQVSKKKINIPNNQFFG